MRSVRIEHGCNLDMRALLDEKFPGILNPLKHAKVGTFTSVLTARDAFDYVEKSCKIHSHVQQKVTGSHQDYT